jgi:hypothetical protein
MDLCGIDCRIEAPILLDLLHRDFKRARKARATCAPNARLDIRDKIKDIRNKNADDDNNSQLEENKKQVTEESHNASAKFNEQFDQEVILLRKHLEDPSLKRLMGRQLKVHAVDIVRTYGSVESFIEAIRGLESIYYKNVKRDGTELQMAQFVVNSVRKRMREVNAAQL